MSVMYNVKTLYPATGYWVVYSQELERGNPSKGVELWAEPFQFLGVAHEVDHRRGHEEVASIVAIQLSDGRFHICDEDSNFEGVIMAGMSADAIASFFRYDNAVKVTTPEGTATVKPEGATP